MHHRSGFFFTRFQMLKSPYSHGLHWFAILVALCALGLIGMGGLVTSHGVGMAVPDWPTSYGYNMFALPISMWLTGGVFHEHTHRLWASALGVLVIALTRWIGGRQSRLPLAIIGGGEVVAGQALILLGGEWKGAGHFLSGIGGVVLLAALVWARNERSSHPLPTLVWLAFWGVQLQGLLGGLRVVLDAHLFAGTRLGVWFGVFHGCLAQAFLVLVVVIGVMSSRWWVERATAQPGTARSKVLLFTMGLIFLQLIIGATMRHQHAGLAIPDFPKAYGTWWPDISEAAVARYNANRVELSAHNPITAFQIGLQMVHRLVALTIAMLVGACLWRAKGALRRLCSAWFILIIIQAGLGMWTIWSNKAADVATLHVITGALSLVTGAVICLISGKLSPTRD